MGKIQNGVLVGVGLVVLTMGCHELPPQESTPLYP